MKTAREILELCGARNMEAITKCYENEKSLKQAVEIITTQALKELREIMPKKIYPHTNASENTDDYITVCNAYNSCLKEVIERLK